MLKGIASRTKSHYGVPVVTELEPITVARIPITGDRLEESVILHPRYVPLGVDHEIMQVQGYRRGRTLDIFLPEPMEHKGKEYTILNFKGVGRNADRELVIHPVKWYTREGTWIPGKKADQYGRSYGALKQSDAPWEFYETILADHNISHIAHVAMHDLPLALCEHISSVEGETQNDPLTQIVRASNTNIRMIEPDRIRHHPGTVDPEDLVQIDVSFVQAQRRLALNYKMIQFRGSIADNRLVTGEFLDLENYKSAVLNIPLAVRLIGQVMLSSLGILDSEEKQQYATRVGSILPITPEEILSMDQHAFDSLKGNILAGNSLVKPPRTREQYALR